MVSIVIPKRKGEDISKCLDSISQSKYKGYEIIIVDEGLERSEQRNIGIGRAKGEYVLILDSDQYISQCLLTDCVWRAERGYDAIYIPEKIITTGWFGRLRDWERQFYTATCVDVPRFVRKSACPYFDRSMSGPEDSDWGQRIPGLRATSIACLYHEDNVTLLSYFSKKAYYSKSMKRYQEKWPDDKVLDFKYRCFQIFLEDGKWKRFIKSPIAALGVMTLIFIRGIIYLCARESL